MDARNSCRGLPRRNTEPNITTCLSNPTSLDSGEQLARIDREIMRTEDGIVKLVMQRAFLKRRRNSFSPAVNLPPELLALIFEFACLPNGGEFDDDDSNYRHGEGLHGGTNLGLSVGVGAVTPFFVGTVCSKWRQVSRDTSQLWGTVTLHMDNRHAEAQAILLQSWLKLSAQRPLWIKVVEDDANDNDSHDDWGIDVTSTAILDVLAVHSQQWHTIDLFLPSTWEYALSRIKHDLPVLKSATLRVAEGSPSMARVDAFSLAPQLREVRLVGFSIADVHLPWMHLQRLHGEYFGLDECLDTLRQGTKLRTCQFEQVYRGVHPFVARPLRHEQLESFELIMDTTHEFNSLFGAMTLPNLKELVVSICDNVALLCPITPLIRRSACGLQRVHLVGLTPTEDELIGFLKEVPTLRVFMLINPVPESGGKLTQRFLDLMNPRWANARISREDEMDQDQDEISRETCLVPMLERLEYQGATGFTPHDFVELLVSRWRMGNFKDDQAGRPQEPMWVEEDDPPPPFEPHIEAAGFIERPITPTQVSNYSQGTGTPITPTTQLRSVIFTTTRKIKFDGADAKIVLGLIKEGMHLDFLDDPNAD